MIKVFEMKKIFLLLGIAMVMSACERPSVINGKADNDRMLLATLYQQSSAEAAALYHQAYNFARIMVHNELQNQSIKQKRAIIIDVDETVLDNSPYQALCIVEGINYPERWDEWCLRAEAPALPGSQRFLNYVASQDIEVFYVTNRKEHLKDATLENLKRRAFPFADEDHIFMRKDQNTKEPRRKSIEKDYRVIMLLGDNLEDFTNAFENRDPEERMEIVERLKDSFGRRFILFPNAMYGSWESSIYLADTSGAAKETVLREYLRGF